MSRGIVKSPCFIVYLIHMTTFILHCLLIIKISIVIQNLYIEPEPTQNQMGKNHLC